MRVYLLSLGAGLLVGVVYSLIGVRSPAPPAVALVGLLGILLGEQLIPLARQVAAGTPVATAWTSVGSGPHLFGLLPGRHGKEAVVSNTTQEPRP